MDKVIRMKRERLSEMIAFRVYSSLYRIVVDLASSERRKLSEVELALFERGVAAFQRDGSLFEPESEDASPMVRAPQSLEVQLNDLPYGAIELNEEGVILAYNKAETAMSRISDKKAIGKNFFTLAPCAEIQDFHGRYHAFLKGSKPSEEFAFDYKFPHGTSRVLVTFTRLGARRVLVTTQKRSKLNRQKTA